MVASRPPSIELNQSACNAPNGRGPDRRKTTVLHAALLAGLLLSLASTNASAQLPSAVTDDARASLVTVLPGTKAYNIFGHSAIRIVDPSLQLDALFNYGTFDFTPTFVPKFIRGKLDYSLSVSGTARSIQFYMEEERTVVEQNLRLDSSQVQDLYLFLFDNYRPENRYYRYDFFFDNCSTRIRDAFTNLLGDDLALSGRPGGESFRDLLHPYLVERPLLSVGIDLIIGADADRSARYSERAFLPVELEHQLSSATIGNLPFVTSTDTLYVARRGTQSYAWVPSAIAWIMLLAATLISVRNRSSGQFRRTDGSLLIVTGIVGLGILFLWYATDHVVTDANLNLAWTFPANIIFGVAILRHSRASWLRWYLVVYALALATILAGWPFWKQDLPELLLPVVILLLLRTVARVAFNGEQQRQTSIHQS